MKKNKETTKIVLFKKKRKLNKKFTLGREKIEVTFFIVRTLLTEIYYSYLLYSRKDLAAYQPVH